MSAWFWESPAGVWTANFGLISAVVIWLNYDTYEAIIETCGQRRPIGQYDKFSKACGAAVGAAVEAVYDTLEQIGEYELY